jgi:hypothetical protein
VISFDGSGSKNLSLGAKSVLKGMLLHGEKRNVFFEKEYKNKDTRVN